MDGTAAAQRQAALESLQKLSSQAALKSLDVAASIETLAEVLKTVLCQVALAESSLQVLGDVVGTSPAKAGSDHNSCSLTDRLENFEGRVSRMERTMKTCGNRCVGDVVRIDGLDNVAHLHLNGKKAKLRNWEGPGGRWVVQVLQTREMKSLKVDNLHAIQGNEDVPVGSGDDITSVPSGVHRSDGRGGLCVGDVVEICNLRRAAQLNGSRAEIKAWDDDGGRWLVQLKSGGRKRLRTGNLRRVGEAIHVPSGIRQESSSGRAQAPQFEAGMLVRLNGLNTLSLNGLQGHLQRYDGQSGRWVVQMHGSKEEKSIRAENLVKVPESSRAGQTARVRGLEQAAHLNNKIVEVLKWDVDRGRWAVHIVDEGEEKFLRPESLAVTENGMLLAGCSAVVEGFEQAAELNGCSVVLLSWNPSDSRWLVRVDSTGEDKSLRPRHLRALPAPDADQSFPAGNNSFPTVGSQDGLAEIIGDSSDSDADMLVADCESSDVLREGMAVTILDGSNSGQHATLTRWEDVGGPFGQWLVRLQGSGQEIRLPVSSLEPCT